MLNKDIVSRAFKAFAERECKGISLLYEDLSLRIARDDELLELCGNAQERQPIPNLLFGAVHYLLLRGSDHPLKEFYPSIVDHPKLHKESFPYFKDFCLEYRKAIILILKTRLVQTNEVRRCAYLYPVFSTIYERVKKPLALIEIGTSAGLQLLWDKYSYSFGTKKIYGNKDSNLLISAEVRGNNTPILHSTPPPVSERIGLDLNTIDLNNDADKLWLRALIWPEHKERSAMFDEAAKYIKKGTVNLIEGDGICLLAQYVEEIPGNSVICVFHTHVANQLSREQQKQLMQTVSTIGMKRDVFHIYNNIQDQYLHVDFYLDGIASHNTVAETDGQGRWFEWLLEGELK